MSFGTSIPPKKLFAVTIFNSSLLAWYFFLAQVNFERIFQIFSSSKPLFYFGIFLFYFFGVISAILGCSLGSKYNQRKVLLNLTIYGVVCSCLLFFVQNEFFFLIISSLLGISLGLIFPIAISMIANLTEKYERGKTCALYILQTFIMLAAAIIIQEIFLLGSFGLIFLLILLRLVGFSAFLFDDLDTKIKPDKSESWYLVISNKNFFYFFVPWFLYLIVVVIAEYILWPSFPSSVQDAFLSAEPLQYVGTALCAVISGFLADRTKRRLPIIIGLVMLGISFAMLTVTISDITVFIHILTIGIAFGFIMVMYAAIPGDLSPKGSSEKYYALILVLPLSAYGAIGAIPAMFGITASAALIAPFLGIILFLSVIPLAVAEAITTDESKEREHKQHMRALEKLLLKEK